MGNDRDTARRGKLARLPRAIRDEVCERLQDGADGAEILAWLNGLGPVKKLLAEKFKGEPISEANLSNWRLGGYQDWLDTNRQADETRAIADSAMRIAQASGGGMAEGAAAILAGKIISGIEALSADDLDATVLAVSRLRKMELEGRRIDSMEKRVALDELKVQTQSIELFVEWYTNQAAAELVADKGLDQKAKVEALRKMMFGDRPAHLRDPRAVALTPKPSPSP